VAYHTKPDLTKSEWISVLKLATKWRFNDLRKTAIDALNESQDLTTMERTLLAKEYEIPAWLMQGYSAFVAEMQSLDPEVEHGFTFWGKEDAGRIGWAVVVDLQSIVMARYRSMLQHLPLKDIEEDILASSLLNEEYEIRKERNQVYRNMEEIRKAEDEAKRMKEKVEEAEARRKALALAFAEIEETENRLREENESKRKAEEQEEAATETAYNYEELTAKLLKEANERMDSDGASKARRPAEEEGEVKDVTDVGQMGALTNVEEEQKQGNGDEEANREAAGEAEASRGLVPVELMELVEADRGQQAAEGDTREESQRPVEPFREAAASLSTSALPATDSSALLDNKEPKMNKKKMMIMKKRAARERLEAERLEAERLARLNSTDNDIIEVVQGTGCSGGVK
jgi:hypothetical protein